jgi:uncharacterized membrane protein
MLRFRSVVLSGLIGAVALAPVVAEEPLSLGGPGSYTPAFQPLGDLPGDAFFSVANAVSGDGLTVVGYSRSNSINPNGSEEAFRWRGGEMIALGAPWVPPQYEYLRFSRATGTNYDGSQIIGASTGWDLPVQCAIKWENDIIVGYQPPQTDYRKMASNGAYTGVSWDPSPTPRAFLSSPVPGHSGYILPPPGSMSDDGTFSTNISADGTTVVGYSSPYMQSSPRKPFRKLGGQPTQSLGMLPGFTSCEPTAVSGDGSTVFGYCSNSTTSQRFRWTQGTGMVTGDFPFAPVAVSYDGSMLVAGGSIWDAVNGTRSLKTLLTGYGIDMSAWSFLVINDMSDDGMVFVGYGSRTDGNYEAFRTVLPEPATALLLTPMAMLRRTRQRQRHAR